MSRRDAAERRPAHAAEAEAGPAHADGRTAAQPSSSEAEPQAAAGDAAADGALQAAEHARDAAAQVLDTETLRLAAVRGELADAERSRERCADALAADPSPAAERGFREASDLVATRAAILRAHGRRVDTAKAEVDKLDAGLAEARKAVEAIRLGRAWDEVEDAADRLDGAVATLATGLPRLLQACHQYDLQARQVLGPARLGVVAERETLELALKNQLMNILPNAFRVFPRQQSTLMTILEAVRRRRGAAYAKPVTETAPAVPPAVVVDRSDPTGGEPDPAWLREQDRLAAEARRVPEPLLR